MTMGEVQKKLKQLRKAENDAAKAAEAAINAARTTSAPRPATRTSATAETAARVARLANLKAMETLWLQQMADLYGQRPVPFSEKQCHQMRILLTKLAEAGLRPEAVIGSALAFWPEMLSAIVQRDNPEWTSNVPHLGFLLIHRQAVIDQIYACGKPVFLIQP